jgi:serine/threonine-protein kinase
VLYEMIAGRRPFEGRSAAEVIAHVLHDDPPRVESLRADVPPEIARIVQKCLIKEPARRYQHADDLALDLRDAATQSEARAATPAPATTARRRPGVGGWLAAVAAGALIGAVVTWQLRPVDRDPSSSVRFSVQTDLNGILNRVIAVSPDGQRIVYTNQGEPGLLVRVLDQVEPRGLPGTAGARDIAVSSDSQHMVFWVSDQIKRVPIDGGPVVTVGPAPGRPLGISWAPDGFIYYGRGAEGIWRIRESGGRPELVAAMKPGQYAHGPQLLAGGAQLIYTRASRVNGWNDAAIVAMRPGSEEERIVVEPAHDARAVPGFLIYVHDGLLRAMTFDEGSASVSGEPVLLAEGVGRSVMDTTGATFFGISNTGVLAYVGGRGFDSRQMTWLEVGSAAAPLPVAAASITQVRLSPDGRKIAARVFDNGSHIFLYDVDRPSGTRITTDGSHRNPVWSNDGDWIYFASDKNGTLDVWRRRSDLGSPAELVFAQDGNQVPVGLAPDGTLVLLTLDPSGSTISKVNPAQPTAVTVLVDRPQDAPEAALTRDGRYLAYQMNTGRGWQIRTLDLTTGRHTTVEQGWAPAWSPDGTALLYQGTNGIFVAPFSPSTGIAGKSDRMIDRVMIPGCCDLANGRRVLALEGAAGALPATVVINWQ